MQNVTENSVKTFRKNSTGSLFSSENPLDPSLFTVVCGSPAGIVCTDLPADVLI